MTGAIKPIDGILNIEGVIQENNKTLSLKKDLFNFSFKVKASANIPSGKVLIANGYDNTSEMIIGKVLDDLNQPILGVSESSCLAGETCTLIRKGVITSSLNGTGKTVGDLVYVDSSGQLSFTESTKSVGTLLTTTPNAKVFVNIKNDASIYQYPTTLTPPIEDSSIRPATTEYVDNVLKRYYLGRFWVPVSAAQQNSWRSVTYGNGKFLAVADNGTNRIMTSSNGVSWTAVAAPQQNQWTSIAYGNNTFVSVGYSAGTNGVMTSIDGDSWSLGTIEQNYWRSVTYGNNVFVTVTDTGVNRVARSTDNGTTWNTYLVSEPSSWCSVTYGNSLFVAVAYSGTANRVMTSPDGQNWAIVQSTGPNSFISQSDWRSVTYGNGLFVAVANNGPNRIMTSSNGTDWTPRTAPEQNQWFSVTYGDGLFVAVAQSGTNRIMTSRDGINWNLRTAPEQNVWTSVTYGNGTFVSVSNTGTNRVMLSTLY
jgi:hypothetical protein